jgi:hypothetical protein
LNLGIHTLKAGAIPLESCLQSIVLWLFGRGISQTIFPGWPQTATLPISPSPVARITSHQHPACFYP